LKGGGIMPKRIVNVEKGKQGFQRTQSRAPKPPTASSRPLFHPILKPSTPPKDNYGDFGYKRTEYGTNLLPIPEEDLNPDLMAYWVIAYDEDLPSDAENNIPVGWISWSKYNGVVYFIKVREEFQRLGIATHMVDIVLMLAENNVTIKPKHSDNRTPSGDALSRKIGGDIPVNLGEGLHDWMLDS